MQTGFFDFVLGSAQALGDLACLCRFFSRNSVVPRSRYFFLLRSFTGIYDRLRREFEQITQNKNSHVLSPSSKCQNAKGWEYVKTVGVCCCTNNILFDAVKSCDRS